MFVGKHKKKDEIIGIIAEDILRYVLTSRAQFKIRWIRERNKKKKRHREKKGKGKNKTNEKERKEEKKCE